MFARSDQQHKKERRRESRYEYANSWLHTPAVSWTDWLRRAGLPYFRLLMVSPISIIDKKKMKILSRDINHGATKWK